jgi:hypothetical protein
MKPATDPLSEEVETSTYPPILFKDNFYYTILYSAKFPKLLLHLGIPTKIMYAFSFSPKHVTYTPPRPHTIAFHPALFDQFSSIWREVQLVKLLLHSFLQPSFTSSVSNQKFSLSHYYRTSSLYLSDLVSYICITTGKIVNFS